MTTKEKAIELTDKMFNTQNSPCTWQGAKICALIAVDEIISIKLLWYQKDTKELNYWQEVKQEIEKL
jgi:hypothetical protein